MAPLTTLRVLFTGGGTAGHVTPNIALIEAARTRGWQVSYAGSGKGIEREMMARIDVPFRAVASGKLRRYFSWENFIDPFRIAWGVLQSLWLCLSVKPDVVFSKGGFVSVPVVVAAWLCRVPVISHESDVTPGLANRIAFPFCTRICVTFDETAQYLPAGKVVIAGTPIREALVQGDTTAGLRHLGLGTDLSNEPGDKKPLLLVFGGSLGSKVLNDQVLAVLPRLLEKFNLVHIVGAGNEQERGEEGGESSGHYVQREFLHDEFGDVLAAADVVVSRAGANSLYELMATRTPHLLIPLSRAASRGDQIVNAETFTRRGFSRMIEEGELTNDRFVEQIFAVYEQREEIIRTLETFEIKDSVTIILDLLETTALSGL